MLRWRVKLIHGGVIKKHLIKPLTSSNEFYWWISMCSRGEVDVREKKRISKKFLYIANWTSLLLHLLSFSLFKTFYVLFAFWCRSRKLFIAAHQKWKMTWKNKQKVFVWKAESKLNGKHWIFLSCLICCRRRRRRVRINSTHEWIYAFVSSLIHVSPFNTCIYFYLALGLLPLSIIN